MGLEAKIQLHQFKLSGTKEVGGNVYTNCNMEFCGDSYLGWFDMGGILHASNADGVGAAIG